MITSAHIPKHGLPLCPGPCTSSLPDVVSALSLFHNSPRNLRMIPSPGTKITSVPPRTGVPQYQDLWLGTCVARMAGSGHMKRGMSEGGKFARILDKTPFCELQRSYQTGTDWLALWDKPRPPAVSLGGPRLSLVLLRFQTPSGPNPRWHWRCCSPSRFN